MESPFSHPVTDHPEGQTVSVYRYVLNAFPKLGRAPTLSEVKRDLGLEEWAIADALRTLETHDALRLDPATRWIAEAYPYSASETKHVVVFQSGERVHCMCAIDCFYVPFLIDCDITIHSTCHLCDRAIAVRIPGQKIATVDPRTTVVWDSDAPYDCPKTNFFCCEAHLQTWTARAPEEPGAPRTLEEARERGRVAALQIRRVIGA